MREATQADLGARASDGDWSCSFKTVHYGRATALTQQRNVTLDTAFAATPNRFKHVAPSPPVLPAAAWINPPKKDPISIIATPGYSLIS